MICSITAGVTLGTPSAAALAPAVSMMTASGRSASVTSLPTGRVDEPESVGTWSSIPDHQETPLGARASRRPSPNRFRDITRLEIASPGQIAIHGACDMKFLAELSMLPQLGSGGCWPRPRNDRLASAMIAAAVANVACTSTGGTTFGEMRSHTMGGRGV